MKEEPRSSNLVEPLATQSANAVEITMTMKGVGKVTREFHYTIVDNRLDDLMMLADKTGYALDQLVSAIGRADQKTFDACFDTPSILPRYIASSVSP